MQLKGTEHLLIFLAIGSFILLATAQYSHSSVDDVEIILDGYKNSWKCDGIYCPANTFRCHVSKEKRSPHSTVITRENICYDENNNILKRKIKNETNPSYEQTLSMDTYRNGLTINSSGNYGNNNSVNTHFDSEQLEKELEFQFGNLNKLNEHIEENINAINSRIEEQLLDVQKNLGNIFRNLP